MAESSPFLFFIIAGVALITAELLIFNMSLFWFLFVGIGALIAAVVVWFIPGVGWLYASVTFVIASALTSIALYKPLRRWQQKPGAMPGNDAIGQHVNVLEEISQAKSGKVTWSGAVWDAKLVGSSEPLQKGENAVIAEITGIVLLVQKP
ncbi:NfeD family protein [Agarilytica rhodophyticola]|uniref:NfeD family protein n=1 Tax=Agarilytica rhodophyticola TaxID=1737490 RepID=UPI000B342BE3|nr:NfeD family protein [Agarilytica rhodophyticola]